MATEIKIVDFSRFPFGRYPSHGPYNGQTFRREVLIPALTSSGDDGLVVDLAGAKGLGPSFLEEAFGGMVRDGVSVEALKSRLKVRSPDKSVVALVERYISEAAKAKAH